MVERLKVAVLVLISMVLISCSSGAFYESIRGGVVVNMGITSVDNPLVFSGVEQQGVKGEYTHQILFVFHDSMTGRPVVPESVSVKLSLPTKKVLIEKELEPAIYKDIGVRSYSLLFRAFRNAWKYKLEMVFKKDGESYKTRFSFRI